MPPSTTAPAVPFGDAVRLWAKIGFLSFGGPAGQIALMHRLIVAERGWVPEDRFLHALNFCMVLPGPEAQQLATYIGWLLHGVKGAVVAGLLFVLPGAMVMLALSVLYATYQDLTFVEALFFGVKAAVLAIVIDAVIRIGKRAVKSAVLLTIAAAAFTGIFFFDVPFPLIILAAAVAGWWGGRTWPHLFPVNGAADAAQGAKPARRKTRRAAIIAALLWLAPTAGLFTLFGWDNVFSQLAGFFSVMAVVTFGGAYAVLAYVAQEAVANFGWLNPGEMLDGLGLAETTPGPLILVTQFVGFLAAFREATGLDPWLAGVLGALLVSWVTFAPSFLWILAGAPYVETLRGNRVVANALAGVTAAVVGVILNLALWFGLHALFTTVDERHVGVLRLYVPDIATIEPWACVIAVLALAALVRFRAGMIPVLAASFATGLAVTYLF